MGLVYYLEYMLLMGFKCFFESGSFFEFLKKYGGSYNVSMVLYWIVYYFEIENDVLVLVVDCLVDVIVELLLDLINVDCECNVVNVELMMVCFCDGMCMV